jgi:hypothetical protein
MAGEFSIQFRARDAPDESNVFHHVGQPESAEALNGRTETSGTGEHLPRAMDAIVPPCVRALSNKI